MFDTKVLDPISFLAVVAACAGDNDVLKLIGPAEGMRHNMIELEP
jgi:hypothetical protein